MSDFDAAQEWPTPLEAVQHMLRLMFTMLVDHLIIQVGSRCMPEVTQALQLARPA